MKNENFIFPIFIFQLFYTFFGRGNIASHLEARALRVNGRLASMDASRQWTPRVNGRPAPHYFLLSLRAPKVNKSKGK